jgi:hypothetical protein
MQLRMFWAIYPIAVASLMLTNTTIMKLHFFEINMFISPRFANVLRHRASAPYAGWSEPFFHWATLRTRSKKGRMPSKSVGSQYRQKDPREVPLVSLLSTPE